MLGFVALLPLLVPVQAIHFNPFRRSHHAQLSDREMRDLAQRELEERLMPITATTTIFVEQTMTQTIWVEPTGQVIFPVPSFSASSSAEISSSSSASDTSSAIGTESSVTSSATSESVESASASPTESLESSSPSVSSFSSAPTSSGSNVPRQSRSSGSGGPRPTPSPTVSSVESISASASAESSYVDSGYSSSFASGSSSSYYSEGVSSSAAETLWTESSSAILSSATAASYSASASIPASSTSSASGSSSTLTPLSERLMNAYYPDWSGWYLSPENVDWSKFDVIDFAFALPTADGGLQFTQDDSSDLLKRLVTTGHAAGKRVKLSIGGWTGSAYFSTITADDSLRATFVNNILTAYQAYNLDGIDIDWEYPGVSGASGNAVSSSDSANYLTFLQDLRAALPSDALISAATQVWPFAGSDRNPMSDVSGFAAVLDWILIMNYDIWGSSSTPGPNAPLSDGCGNSTQPLANAYAAVSSWTTAGMPANKITLGVPAYGYLQSSSASSLRQRRSVFPQPPHRRAGSKRGDVTVYNGNGGSSDGQVMFASLISQGALTSDGQGGFVGDNGFVRYWDSCSSTPWLKSDATGQIVTYDDTESMSLKGQFAAKAGIRGCNVFSADGDWTGSSWPLTDAVRSGLGL